VVERHQEELVGRGEQVEQEPLDRSGVRCCTTGCCALADTTTAASVVTNSAPRPMIAPVYSGSKEPKARDHPDRQSLIALDVGRWKLAVDGAVTPGAARLENTERPVCDPTTTPSAGVPQAS
jgi:hypothetical protein